MAKFDVFISYSRKDSTIVKSVADKLRKENLSVWIDEDGIESGDLFKKVITTAIENSTCLLFFSSESSNNSTWTAKEIGIAIYEKIPVIPVILDDAKYNPEIKFDLVNLDFVDMKEERFRDKSIARIVKSVKKLHQNSDYKASKLNTVDECEEVHEPRVKKNQNKETKLESQVSDIGDNPNTNISDKKTYLQILRKSFSYSNIHITLFVVLFIFGGVIGLVLYPIISIIYYEIRRHKGLEIPNFYRKYRRNIIILSCILYFVIIAIIGFIFYDSSEYNSSYEYYGEDMTDSLVVEEAVVYGDDLTDSIAAVEETVEIIEDNDKGYADFQLGHKCLENKQYDLAMKYFRISSEMGNAASTYMIGYLYWYGLGVRESEQKAMEYFQYAAALGDETAIEFLKSNNINDTVVESVY